MIAISKGPDNVYKVLRSTSKVLTVYSQTTKNFIDKINGSGGTVYDKLFINQLYKFCSKYSITDAIILFPQIAVKEIGGLTDIAYCLFGNDVNANSSGSQRPGKIFDAKNNYYWDVVSGNTLLTSVLNKSFTQSEIFYVGNQTNLSVLGEEYPVFMRDIANIKSNSIFFKTALNQFNNRVYNNVNDVNTFNHIYSSVASLSTVRIYHSRWDSTASAANETDIYINNTLQTKVNVYSNETTSLTINFLRLFGNPSANNQSLGKFYGTAIFFTKFTTGMINEFIQILNSKFL